MSNFTPEDLLEYFYEETAPNKTVAVRAALVAEWPLQQKYHVITQAAERLNKSLVPPRKQSVKAVIDHAAKHVESAGVDL